MAFLAKLFGGGGGNSISAGDYNERYFKQKNHVLIDVRTKNEFKSGHIPGAKNIPLATLSQSLKRIPQDKTVVLVCRSGSRSGVGARTLQNAGYDEVLNMSGGMLAWNRQNLPVKR